MTKVTWLIDLGDSEQGKLMLNNLKYWARVQGVTQKRMILLGIASYIDSVDGNPELIKQIADYLSMPRKGSKNG